MSRFSRYDTDEERLPEGMQRVGYDADTQVYTFQDVDGSYWESAPGCQYGQLTRVSDGHHDDAADTEPFLISNEMTPGKSWRTELMPLLNFGVLIGVCLLGLFWYLHYSASGNKSSRPLCAPGLASYVIKQDDTCWAIGNDRGVSVDELLRLNKGLDCDKLARLVHDSIWDGAVKSSTGVNYVSEVVTVPGLFKEQASSVSAWVGIDGDEDYDEVILYTGFNVYAGGRFDTWYEWCPADAQNYDDDFDVKLGDQILMTVQAFNDKTSGYATLENLAKGQSTFQKFQVQLTLCLKDADVILDNFANEAVVYFGKIEFTNTICRGDYGMQNPEDANIYNMEYDNEVETDCRTYADGVVRTRLK